MVRVPFDRDSFNKCLCGGCPVNRSSACVRSQEAAFAPLAQKIEREGHMPDPSITPGVYCAGGGSSCNDLDDGKSCLCPACPVHLRFGLSNSFYCLKGSSEEVG